VPRQPHPIKTEALIRGVASNLPQGEAAARAGYSRRGGFASRLLKRSEIADRVVAAKREFALASANLAPVIVALLDAAELALRDRKGDYGAVARMLAEAASLKQKLPPAPAPDEESEAEWAARWVPKR
jgi:hypothetical protein